MGYMSDIVNTNMTLYIDFDSTLFNTRAFAAELWKILSAGSGVPLEQVKKDAVTFQIDPIFHGYDFEAHMAAYNLDSVVYWKRLDNLVQENNFLYDDSAHFLQTLRAKGYAPQILSFGEPRFQQAKIIPNLSRLVGGQTHQAEQPLKYMTLLGMKNDYIAHTHPGGHGALVDDVPNQKLPSGFAEIHIDRQHAQAAAQHKPGGYTVSNLEQALQAITEL